MIKRFCDKCGKEITNELPISISISNYEDIKSKDFDVCSECNKEYTMLSDAEHKIYLQKLASFFKKEE